MYPALITVLIETLWNVNIKDMRFNDIRKSVLIETLWNVNLIVATFSTLTYCVLIETLWNVNTQEETAKQKELMY